MNQQEIMATAQQMFLNNFSRKQVMDFLTESGIEGEKVGTLATEAYLAIKEQRKEVLEEQAQEVKKEMNKSLMIGVAVLVGGVIATLTTGRIWYGAMGVGLVMIFNGFRN